MCCLEAQKREEFAEAALIRFWNWQNSLILDTLGNLDILGISPYYHIQIGFNTLDE